VVHEAQKVPDEEIGDGHEGGVCGIRHLIRYHRLDNAGGAA